MSGERGWIKTKNRYYRRCEMERESAFKEKRSRQFVRARPDILAARGIKV